MSFWLAGLIAKTSSTYLFHIIISTGEFVKIYFLTCCITNSALQTDMRTHGGTRYLLEELIIKLEDSIFQANFDKLESTFFSKRSMGAIEGFRHWVLKLEKLQQGRLVYLWIIVSHQMKSWRNFREWWNCPGYFSSRICFSTFKGQDRFKVLKFSSKISLGSRWGCH